MRADQIQKRGGTVSERMWGFGDVAVYHLFKKSETIVKKKMFDSYHSF